MSSIISYGNILKAYSALKKLEGYPGFSLEKLCNDLTWNYDEVRHYITFCEKIQKGDINVGALKDYERTYNQMAKELLQYVNKKS